MACCFCDFYSYGDGVTACNKTVTLEGFTYVGLNLNRNSDGRLDWGIGEGCPSFSREQEDAAIERFAESACRELDAEYAIEQAFDAPQDEGKL